jgi:hypothetical protein
MEIWLIKRIEVMDTLVTVMETMNCFIWLGSPIK